VCTNGWPLWLLNAWGWPDDTSSCLPWTVLWGVLYTPGQPVSLDTFFLFYPKFAGPQTTLYGCGFTAGSSLITVPSSIGLAPGQFVQAPGLLPQGSTIVSVNAGQITVSTQALSTGTGSLVTYSSPPIPIAVVQSYLNLAQASLPYGVYQDSYAIAVGLFVAHYCTLYLQTDAQQIQQSVQVMIHGEAPQPQGPYPTTTLTLSQAPPNGVLQSLTKQGLMLTPGVDYTLNGGTISLSVPALATDTFWAIWPMPQLVSMVAPSSPAQIAASGIANGILTSKSVGDVSAGYAQLEMNQWGAFQLTKYGQQLITMAKSMFCFPVWVY
jgi:hypothetical protein